MADDLLLPYYTEKLWELIPPLHRDADADGALRGLVEVLAGQAAILRRSIDRLWEDSFVEWCDTWAVPYLGDLVGTRAISALDPRGRRTDVANTIYYRRRSGTLTVLEGLTADITGWDGTGVEEYRTLLRMPHLLDPAPAPTGRFTRTPAHALPDLRAARGAQLTDGPWDEYAHLPDVRRHHGGVTGRAGISKVAFHLYRLDSTLLERVPARPTATAGLYTVDPSGRTIPLFALNTRPDLSAQWQRAVEWELPGQIRCEVLGHAEYVVREAHVNAWTADQTLTAAQAGVLRRLRGILVGGETALRRRITDLFAITSVTPPGAAALRRILHDTLVADCGKAALLPGGDEQGPDRWSIQVETRSGGNPPIRTEHEQVVAADLSAGPVTDTHPVLVDAEHGLVQLTGTIQPDEVLISYAYGFSGPVGAGGYTRLNTPVVPAAAHRSGGGAVPAPAAGPDGAVAIDDNDTYGPVAAMTAAPRLVLTAAGGRRPYLELGGDLVLTAGTAGAELVLDGWWLGSRAPRSVRLQAVPGADWGSVRIRHCTFDAGGVDLAGAALEPVTLVVESSVTELVVDSCLLGPLDVAAPTGFVRSMTITSSVLHCLDQTSVALRQPDGDLTVHGCTVIGRLEARRIEASELLCTGRVVVEDLQTGCVRFSGYAPGSAVPRPYLCVEVADVRSLFTSVRVGDPGYCQLSGAAPDTVVRGGEDRTEIGVFHALLIPAKLDGLQAKVEEFLPFGLIPLYVTES